MHPIHTKPVGFSSEQRTRISTALQTHIDQGHVAGMITLLTQQGKIVHQATHGVMDLATSQPMPLDAIFRIASMTKPITSVAVMMLYEEGHFDLDTPISAFVPAFGQAKVLVAQSESDTVLVDLETEITIRHLLTHTSGLAGYFEPDGTPIEQMYHLARVGLEQSDPPLTLKKMIETLATVPLAHQPGTRWAYGMGLDVLAYLVEVLTGMPYEQFLQSRIFEPLNMEDTAYHLPSEKAHRLVRVHRYHLDNAQLKREEALWMQVPPYPPSYVEGGNMLVSTVSDYAQFAQMLLNKGELGGVRLLQPETVDLIASNHVTDDILKRSKEFFDYQDGYGFGLGVRVRIDETRSEATGSNGEYGWGGLYGTVFWIDPVKSFFGLLMMQQFGFSPTTEFKKLVHEALI